VAVVVADAPRAQAETVIRFARRWSDPGQVDREVIGMINAAQLALAGDGSREATLLRLRLNAHLAKKLSFAVSQDTAPGSGPERGVALARRTLREIPADCPDEACTEWIFGESQEIVATLEADMEIPADTLRQTRLGQAYWLLHEQAHKAEMALAGWPTVIVGPVARARGLLALARGDDAGALECFRSAASMARTSRPHMARLRADRARALLLRPARETGEEASMLLATSLAAAERLGMARLAADIRTLQATTLAGVRPSGPARWPARTPAGPDPR
jgi:hypothetical protein